MNHSNKSKQPVRKQKGTIYADIIHNRNSFQERDT